MAQGFGDGADIRCKMIYGYARVSTSLSRGAARQCVKYPVVDEAPENEVTDQ